MAHLIGVVINLLPKISEYVGALSKVADLVKFSNKMKSKDKFWIPMNVGGEEFMTTKAIVSEYPDSIFMLMLESEKIEKQREILELDDYEKEKIQKRMNKWGKKNDVYLFDRDPKYFAPILFYMRTGKFTYNEKISLEGIREEAKFFELNQLEKEIRKIIYQKKFKDQEEEKEKQKNFETLGHQIPRSNVMLIVVLIIFSMTTSITLIIRSN